MMMPHFVLLDYRWRSSAKRPTPPHFRVMDCRPSHHLTLATVIPPPFAVILSDPMAVILSKVEGSSYPRLL